jgi:hypothetical protein
MLEQMLDRVGDRNPQLFRELKGRIKARNLIITSIISIFLQFSLFIVSGINFHPKGAINLFFSMSIWAIFALLVGGTYMIINDLNIEEKRGTLYFVRLSPSDAKNIILGKIIGVPFLLFFGVILTLPLHLWAGFLAQINLGLILCFYINVFASCLFFYSFAALISFISYQVQNLKAWGGACVVLSWLSLAMNKPIIGNPLDWINFYSPDLLLKYLNDADNFINLQFFYLPIGKSFITVFLLSMVILLISTSINFWGIERRFYNRHTTIISKKQSYQQTLFNGVFLVGLAAQKSELSTNNVNGPLFNFNFYTLLVISLFIFGFLVYSIIPQKQSLQDWARYHHRENRDLMNDLIFGERSPGSVAIAINLGIVFVVIGLWTLAWGDAIKTVQGLAALLMTMIIMVIYAIMAEISVLIYKPIFLKNKQPQNEISLLTTIGLMFLPLIFFGIFGITPDKVPFLWMFSFMPWVGVQMASPFMILLGFLGQVTVLGLSSLSLKNTLIKVGESETKMIDERIREV